MRRSKPITGQGASAALWAVIVGLALLCLAPTSALAERSCANEARRAEQASAYLPNCRAYEQVTPVAKDNSEPSAVVDGLAERQIFEPIIGARAADDGERMAWVSEYSPPGLAGPSSPGLDYLSTRNPTNGWATEATVPLQSPQNGLLCPNLEGIVGWSSDLTNGILSDGDAQQHGGDQEAFYEQSFGCGHAEPALRESDGKPIVEPEGFQNLFLRDSSTDTFQLVNVTPSTAPTPTPRKVNEFQPYFPANFVAGSANLSNVVFEDELPLTEEAEKLTPEVEAACKEEPQGRGCWEGHDDLYVWSEGQQPAVRLVTVLSDGKPVEGALAGATRNAELPTTVDKPTNVAGYRHAISADGSRIFFEAEGNLYVRENAGQPPVDECGSPAAACTIQLDVSQRGSAEGGGKWLGANAEGTKVFFTDESALTSTAKAASGANLYEYELPAEAGKPGTLVDLTPDASAEVLGISGLSEDGSYVYFVATGNLTAGLDKVTGRSPEEAEPSQGADNLYVSHEGTTAFIGTLGPEDLCDWTSDTGCRPGEPSNPGPSGLTARVSGNGLNLAFNSVNPLTGYGNTDSVTGEADNEIFLYEAENNHLACASCNPIAAPSAGGAAIDYAARSDTNAELMNVYPQRNVSETGQVFFETAEVLLPQQDTNGVRDVYEYEHGALHPISSGSSTAPSYFMDASANGSDVFFATAQKLLPRDTDSAYDIYDARVGGGFPEPAPLAATCESEACRDTPGASTAFPAPSSVTFAGPGNVAQTMTNDKPKKKRSAGRRRRAALTRALRRCERRDRHNRARRRACERRARRDLSGKAKRGGR